MIKKQGFTLVELLSVIVVLAIILAIAVPSISNVIRNSTKGAFNADAKMVLKAIEYKKLEDNNFNPLEITKANMNSILGISDENYEQINFLISDDTIEAEIVGQNKWDGLIAYGTIKNMNVVNAEDYEIVLPSITIIGDNPIEVGRGSTYIDSGATANDVEEGEILLLSIVIRNEAGGVVENVDTSSLGTFTITYTAVNSKGHEGSSVRRVNVVDRTVPVITLVGSSQVSINKGSTYTDAGVTALDDVDGDITSNIVTIGSVNPNVLGTYIITYNVSDAAGNGATQVTRTVNVVDASAPIITIFGDNPVTIFAGSTYSDAGATAIDDEDGNVTSSIVTTGVVNPSVVGTYIITYNVEDSAGNKSIASRTVNVIDITLPSVAFGTNGNSTYAKSRSTTVTVSDIYSGIDSSSLKYQWTTSTNTPMEVTFTSSFTNGGTINSPSGVSGSYYLWILGKDISGNTIITSSNLFNLDNTIPTVTDIITSISSITGTTFTINRSGNASDMNGGLAANPYIYQISTDGTSWTAKCTNNTTTCNVTGVTANILHYYRICVNDIASNQACTNSGTITPVDNYFCGPLSGTAQPAEVLTGQTFYNQTGYKTGTMPSNGSQTSTLTINGSATPTKNIPAGYTTGGTVTAQLDSALASSIKKSVTIGGVTGTLESLTTEKKWASGTFNTTYYSGNTYGAQPAKHTMGLISGLDFTPTTVFILVPNGVTISFSRSGYNAATGTIGAGLALSSNSGNVDVTGSNGGNGTMTVALTSDGFEFYYTLKASWLLAGASSYVYKYQSGSVIQWYAYS